MTDRINSLHVTLKNDVRDDDCQHIVNAIQMIKGVMAVHMNVTDHADRVAQDRVRSELHEKLFNVIYPSREQ